MCTCSHLMKEDINLSWENIHTIIFDFDGVFTDNKVYISENGTESVKCDRGDGLALDMLRKFIILKDWDLDYLILTKETNPVVRKRAEKLKIKCFDSIDNKLEFIKKRLLDRFYEIENSRKGLIYLGNDLNDYDAMRFSGFSVSPNDANLKIKQISEFTLTRNGGCGFVREFIEKLLIHNSLNDSLLVELLT